MFRRRSMLFGVSLLLMIPGVGAGQDEAAAPAPVGAGQDEAAAPAPVGAAGDRSPAGDEAATIAIGKGMWVSVRPGVWLRGAQGDVAASPLPAVYHVHKKVTGSGSQACYWLAGDVSGWVAGADLMDPLETLAEIARLSRRSPGDPGLYLARGLVETGIGWYRPAVGDFDQVLRLDPWNAIAYYHRAVANNEIPRQRERALGDLYEAIRLDPGNPAYYLARAIVAERLGQRLRAIEDYTTALRLDPRNKQAEKGLDRLTRRARTAAPTQGESGSTGTDAPPATYMTPSDYGTAAP